MQDHQSYRFISVSKARHKRFAQLYRIYWVLQTLTHKPTFVLHDSQQGSGINGVCHGATKVSAICPKFLVDSKAGGPLSGGIAGGLAGTEGSINVEGHRSTLSAAKSEASPTPRAQPVLKGHRQVDGSTTAHMCHGLSCLGSLKHM
jgi:hypothetical protein